METASSNGGFVQAGRLEILLTLGASKWKTGWPCCCLLYPTRACPVVTLYVHFSRSLFSHAGFDEQMFFCTYYKYYRLWSSGEIAIVFSFMTAR